MLRALDYIGIGIGPSNLSLAALAQPLDALHGRCLDQRTGFEWHPGLLLDGATIQVSPMKDLVSLVDPTSYYSFLSYLSEHKRLYRHLTAEFPNVQRIEFNDYLQWVSGKLDTLSFGHQVMGIEYHNAEQLFLVRTTCCRLYGRNVVLGTGRTPYIPAACRHALGPTVVHASDYLNAELNVAGKNVLVVGGGQTGSEVFLDLISSRQHTPREVRWITRRGSFLPLDDSPFINELFFPNYVRYFHGLSEQTRHRLLDEQKLASDGIDMDTLRKIYQKLYENTYISLSGPMSRLLPARELLGIDPAAGGGWRVDIGNTITGEVETSCADVVLLATGYELAKPSYLDPIGHRLHWSGGAAEVDESYALAWDGPPENRIYIQNGARHAMGIADPNLSLLAWRSAKIVNSIGNTQYYDTGDTDSAIQWLEQIGTPAAGSTSHTS